MSLTVLERGPVATVGNVHPLECIRILRPHPAEDVLLVRVIVPALALDILGSVHLSCLLGAVIAGKAKGGKSAAPGQINVSPGVGSAWSRCLDLVVAQDGVFRGRLDALGDHLLLQLPKSGFHP